MSLTPNKLFNNQVTGTNTGTWGIVLNSNFTSIDLSFGGRKNANVAGSSDIVVTAADAQNVTHVLTGLLTGNIKYQLPATGGFYFIQNSTTGNFSVTAIAFGGSTGFVVPRGRTAWIFINPDNLSTISYLNAKSPTITVLTSGSGTYTTPDGVLYLKARLVGAGQGGDGSGTGAGSGGDGTNTTFGTTFLVANAPASGSTAAGGDINITGGTGQPGNGGVINSYGGDGACGPFGGAGLGPNPGPVAGGAATGYGSGGGGASCSTTLSSGKGGNAGGYLEKLIVSPLATYAYVVGAHGLGGTAGTSGSAGGIGGDGIIIIEEFYN